jgi:hypothetical protein
MKARKTQKLFLFVCLMLCVATSSDAANLIRNVNVVDIELGAVIPAQDILIRDGMIVSVEPSSQYTPESTDILDATGKYIIPGLWDSHVHVFSSPEEYKTAFKLYLLNGVTGIRDMGGLLSLEEQKRIAAQVEDEIIIGPRVILSGAWIDASPGSWPGMFLADTPSEGRARVNEIVEQKWAAVKSYSMLAENTYLAIADEAEKRKISLVGHIPESVTLTTAIKAGQNGIEHFGRVTKACSTEESNMISRVKSALSAKDPRTAMISEMATHNKIILHTWDSKLCTSLLEKIAKAKMHVTPTLIVSDFYIGKKPDINDIRMRTLPAQVLQAWNKPDFRLDAMTDELKSLADKSIALDWKTFKLAHSTGVPIIAGTDASFANPYIFHGFSLLDELDRYVEIGLTPREALFTATVTPPHFFGLQDQTGIIAAGRRADLVILDGNPLDSLATLRRPNAVIAKGHVINRSNLDKMLADLQAD